MQTRTILLIIIALWCIQGQAQKIWSGDLSHKDLERFFTGGYTEVHGTITIENYDGKTLSALSSLQKCTGDILLMANTRLESLEGLENLSYVGGRFSIIENPELYNYCQLQQALLTDGIKGVKIRRRVIEKWDVQDNGYNPSLISLKNKNCVGLKPKDFCFSC